MTGQLLAVAGCAVVLVLLVWWDRRAARRWERHVDQALAVVRHPSSRGHLPTCQCRGTLTEPGRHTPRLCAPLRETV